MHLILAPGNPVVGFPVHSDDFVNLAHTSFEWSWPATRPVSELVVRLLSAQGIAAFYWALHALSVIQVAVVFFFVWRLLEAPPDLLLMSAGAVCTMSLESMVERYRYTGSATSLLSGVLGLVGLVLMWASLRRAKGLIWPLAGLALSALALLAKEDVYAAVLAVIVHASVLGRSVRERHAARVLGAFLLAFGVTFAVHNLWLKPSVFLGAAGAVHHTVDLRPDRLAVTAWRLMTVTPGSVMGCLALLAAVALGAVRRHADVSRVALVPVVVALLVLPYSVFPDRVYAYYSANWVPWQFAALAAVATGPWPWPRLARVLALAAVATATVVVTASTREGTLAFYADQGQRSRRTLEALDRLRPALAGHPRVAVAGVSLLNPWRANDGLFLANRLSLSPRWFVLSGSDYLAGLKAFGVPPDIGRVSTRSLGDVGALGPMPVVILRSDGTGSAGWIAPRVSTPARLEVSSCTSNRAAGTALHTAVWDTTGVVEVWERSPSDTLLRRHEGPGQMAVSVEAGALITLERAEAPGGWLAATIVPAPDRPCR